jgi:hypothetical protein
VTQGIRDATTKLGMHVQYVVRKISTQFLYSTLVVTMVTIKELLISQYPIHNLLYEKQLSLIFQNTVVSNLRKYEHNWLNAL